MLVSFALVGDVSKVESGAMYKLCKIEIHHVLVSVLEYGRTEKHCSD